MLQESTWQDNDQNSHFSVATVKFLQTTAHSSGQENTEQGPSIQSGCCENELDCMLDAPEGQSFTVLSHIRHFNFCLLILCKMLGNWSLDLGYVEPLSPCVLLPAVPVH